MARAIRGQFIAGVPGRSRDDNRLYRLAKTVRVLRHLVLPAIEQGSLGQRPREAMLAVEAILAKALPREVVVLARGGSLHSYNEVDVWAAIRTQLSDLGIEDRFSDTCLFLSLQFPAAEHDNVLLHANLCHEVGHEMVSFHRWGDPILAVLPGDTAVQALAARVQPAAEFAGKTQAERGEILEGLVARRGDQDAYDDSGVLTNWLGELLADAVNMCLLGPAAAFATVDLLNLRLGRDDHSFSRSHPRLALRIELQRLHLDRWPGAPADSLTFFDLLKEYPAAYKHLEETHARFDEVAGVVDEVGSEPYLEFELVSDQQFFEAMERALRNKLPEILATIQDALRKLGLLYTPSSFKEEVPQLMERLDLLLPPSATGTFGAEVPASYAGIMNAGALVRLDRLDRIVDRVGRYRSAENDEQGAGAFRAEELVFRLIRKAIADAEIHRRWAAAASS